MTRKQVDKLIEGHIIVCEAYYKLYKELRLKGRAKGFPKRPKFQLKKVYGNKANVLE